MAINLFWFSLNRDDGKENFGDLLSDYIIRKISNKKIIRVIHPSMRRYKYFLKHYLAVGSILEVANLNSIVWGSGLIRKNDLIKKAKFLAVRGPITRKRLLELGYKVPELYGDPAILLPQFYSNNPIKKYKIGIIPHYVDYDIIKTSLTSNKHITIIDLLTNNVEKVIEEILECNYVISSSLHGLIVPHAYGIPALWVKFSDKLGGDNIKFYDYFESVNIIYNNEINLNTKQVELDFLLKLLNDNKEIILPTKKIIRQRKIDLLESNPFK
ncbi:MAG: polysaccharide pyruvyl transferase family protein [Bacteroidetes bacterium HGW-Bacteroidetes-3]|jgi:hypothetical protein|nr:MAG: polysaccharide pyruvyl transferase family protein [Bacteroidetes bacterium HGW-Bacteroidetes-3]